MSSQLMVTASTSLALAASKQGRKILTPRDLCRERGLSLAQIEQGAVYFDSLLGYAILRSDASAILRPRQRRYDKLASSVNFDLEIVDRRWNDDSRKKNLSETVSENESLPAENWWFRELRVWPDQLTGRSQRVAVMDSGIAYGLDALPRRSDHADFCSCNEAGANTGDLEIHGTRCSGVIGARVVRGRTRRSVAPDAHVIAAQVQKRGYINYTTLADLLLMLSWVIHRWRVRVVSMSFSAAIQKQGWAGQDVLGIVAERLRQADRALIFCAAVEQGKRMRARLCFPASAAGVVPVGEYHVDYALPEDPQLVLAKSSVRTPGTWALRDDLLFGPGAGLMTLDSRGEEEDLFGGPSGACAFVAGVAALYMEAFPCRSVERILATMKANARKFSAPHTCTQRWLAIRFPPNRRASGLCELLGPLVRAVSRGWRRVWLALFAGHF